MVISNGGSQNYSCFLIWLLFSWLQSTSDSVLTERSQRTAPVLPNKPPVGGYGKPNLAPKPPGMAPNPPSTAPNTSQTRPSPPSKKVANGGPRPAVSRAQSMKVPRSPPVAPPSGIYQ